MTPATAQGTDDAAAFELAGEQVREPESEHGLDRNADEHVHRRVAERLQEQLILGEDRDEVFKADEFAGIGLRRVIRFKAHLEHVDDRPQHEQAHEDQNRRQQQVRHGLTFSVHPDLMPGQGRGLLLVFGHLIHSCRCFIVDLKVSSFWRRQFAAASACFLS